jgi:hypothetical protein
VIYAPLTQPMLNRHAYVVDDLSLKGSPTVWGDRVVKAAVKHKAVIVVENNQGGALVRRLLKERAAAHDVPPPQIREVWSTKAKQIRAEPIGAAYQRGRVHHLNVLADLEDQLTSWTPEDKGYSPDRLDAVVHGLAPCCSRRRWSRAACRVRPPPLPGRHRQLPSSPGHHRAPVQRPADRHPGRGPEPPRWRSSSPSRSGQGWPCPAGPSPLEEAVTAPATAPSRLRPLSAPGPLPQAAAVAEAQDYDVDALGSGPGGLHGGRAGLLPGIRGLLGSRSPWRRRSATTPPSSPSSGRSPTGAGPPAGLQRPPGGRGAVAGQDAGLQAAGELAGLTTLAQAARVIARKARLDEASGGSPG